MRADRYVRRMLLIGMGLGYAAVMLYLLFVRHRYPMDGYAYNLVPLRTIESYLLNRDAYNFDTWFKNLFGNLVLFIPIGIFLPLLFKRLRRMIPFTAACVLILLAVETMQMLLKVGSFDIDDIILNTIGAWLGLFFTYMIRGVAGIGPLNGLADRESSKASNE
ncbi:VanZ family protein [Paenibacillus sp. J5C_2022]|uniref:VanZ family protein n=1 Tax=Paenibacillus sp. J5C2022 TaxID=2977129 RepID=UPI0021CEC37B|nr:VanZ family protein [Paenibacillus sp. J5C2022]MCU6708542.1 VanZ family protein [Paenibacillus sp. J5C2022]